MISARWFIAGIAAIILGLGIGGLRTPVTVDSKIPMECSEVVARYHDFIQNGVEQPDHVVPNEAWNAACDGAISRRQGWAWTATVVGGVAVLGVVMIRRRRPVSV